MLYKCIQTMKLQSNRHGHYRFIRFSDGRKFCCKNACFFFSSSVAKLGIPLHLVIESKKWLLNTSNTLVVIGGIGSDTLFSNGLHFFTSDLTPSHKSSSTRSTAN